jgi:hypothetical protein
VDLDPVPYLSPVGYWAWPQLVSLLVANPVATAWFLSARFASGAWFVYVDASGVVAEPFPRHNCYPDLPSLDQYNPFGFRLGTVGFANMTLGEVRRFKWTP